MKTSSRRVTTHKTAVKRPVSRARHHAARRAVRAKRSPLGQLFMHPLSLFALLIVGVVLVGLTLRVVADDLIVTAEVQAPALTDGATLGSPHDGDVFSDPNITVSGTCPANSYVTLYRNGIFAGVAVCSGGVYQIQTTLVVGSNTLTVQDYNSTDMAGPTTPSITVTYIPPSGSPDANVNQVSGENEVGQTGSESGGTLPLIIWSQFHFQVFATNEPYDWSLHIEGGMQPYTIHVDWGDGTSGNKSIPDQKTFTVTHTYHKAGYYPIQVTAKDVDGHTASIQLAALIKNPGTPGTISSILNPPAASPPANGGSFWSQHHWLVILWPTFSIILIMVISFWLGERREYLQLLRLVPGHKPRHV